jgi:excisionase family DNA binding protein
LEVVETDVEGERFYTIPEVARILRVSDQSVRRWIKAGELRATKPGKEYRIGHSNLEEFLRAREPRPKVAAPPSFEPTFNDLLAEERRVAEMPAWARAGLEEGGFVVRFERAKAGEEAAYQLHQQEGETFERTAARSEELRARNAPEGEVLAARRDLLIAKARATAAAFLWAEILRGRNVSALDPAEIVASVVEAQRELLEGAPDTTASEASEAS